MESTKSGSVQYDLSNNTGSFVGYVGGDHPEQTAYFDDGASGLFYSLDSGASEDIISILDGSGSAKKRYTHFTNPSAINYDKLNETIYLLDRSHNIISKFDKRGIKIEQVNLSSQSGDCSDGLLDSYSMVISSNYIFISDRSCMQIKVYDKSDYHFVRNIGTNGSGTGQLNLPEFFAVDANNNLIISDSGNNRILKFDFMGNYIGQLGTDVPTGGLLSPKGIAIKSNGDIYVADQGNDRIVILNSNGNYKSSIGMTGTGNGDFTSPQYVVFDGSEALYVSDQPGSIRFQKFNNDTNHTFILSFASFLDNNGNIQNWNDIRGIAFDKNNNIFVNSTQISKFDSNGDQILQFDQKNYSAMNVKEMTIDGDGNLYILGEHQLLKFNSVGDQVFSYNVQGTGVGQLNSARAVSVTPNGKIYVIDAGNNRVSIFDSNGNYLSSFGSSGQNEGQFSSPEGIFVNSNFVWVADTNNQRIQKFNLNGDFIEITLNWGSLETIYASAKKDNQLYIVQSGTSKILHYEINNDGKMIYKSSFGTAGVNPGELSSPMAINIDSSGNIYVLDSFRITKFDKNEQYIQTIGDIGSGDGQFSSAMNFSIHDQYIYVADFINDRIVKFDLLGNFIANFGESGSNANQIHFPYSVRVDSAGNMIIADYGNSKVVILNSAGQFVSSFGNTGTAQENLNSPTDIVFDENLASSSREYYVSSNGDIKVYDSNGAYLRTLGKSSFNINDLTYNESFLKFGSSLNLFFDSQNQEIFVTDTSNYRLVKINTNGEISPFLK